jgi:protein-disulfide isomerase
VTAPSHRAASVREALVAAICLFACSAAAGAATRYLGLEPGVSTRAQVEQALGRETSKVSGTLSEYPPQPGTARILVEYAAGTDVAERIEVFFAKPAPRDSLAGSLGLRAPTATAAGSRLREFYGSPQFVVFTYLRGEAGSGVMSVAYASSRVFERLAASASAVPSSPAAAAPNASASSPTSSATAAPTLPPPPSTPRPTPAAAPTAPTAAPPVPAPPAPAAVPSSPPRNTAAAAAAPFRGAPSAPVLIIEYSNFPCPYCRNGAAVIRQVLSAYGDRVRVQYRHFPIDPYPESRPAAEASLCANEQGKFWDYHDRLYASNEPLSAATLRQSAAALGLDLARFDACISEGRYRSAVEADLAAGSAAGVVGTPTFVINGHVIAGAQPFEAFKQIIEQELQKR